MKLVFSFVFLGLILACSGAVAPAKENNSGTEGDERNLGLFSNNGNGNGFGYGGIQKEFKYPSKMPPPPQMWVEGFASRLHAQNIQKYETPIQVWQTWRLDQIMWNCIASYHPTALNAITKENPILRAPPQHQTSEARALCMIYAVNKLVPELIPISADTISSWLDDLGLDSTIMSDELATIAVEGDGVFTPREMGSYLAAQVIEDMQTDGWNYKGTFLPEGKNCTANCRPFADTTGYQPKNNPWFLNDTEAWQPLIESDDLGFYYAQEHVTPHIGTVAKPAVLNRTEIDAKVLDDPKYNYTVEVDAALAEVEKLDDSAEGLYKKNMVMFMDNKINIAGGMIMQLREKYNLSLEAQVFYHYGYTSTELDVVILSWKEKIRWDRIRPTSLVQLLDDKQVTSFAGTHDAKDWVPLIRVMPHAEYPSGSGCICLGVAQFIDTFLIKEYSVSSIATSWEFNNYPFSFNNMTELANVCGESRLWGGMHFSKSVPDSYELCNGVGERAYTDLMITLLGEGAYTDLIDPDKVTLFY